MHEAMPKLQRVDSSLECLEVGVKVVEDCLKLALAAFFRNACDAARTPQMAQDSTWDYTAWE